MRKLLEFFKTTVKFDIMLRSHYLKTIPELRQCAVCFCTESDNLHDINEQRALKNVFGMKLNNFHYSELAISSKTISKQVFLGLKNTNNVVKHIHVKLECQNAKQVGDSNHRHR